MSVDRFTTSGVLRGDCGQPPGEPLTPQRSRLKRTGLHRPKNGPEWRPIREPFQRLWDRGPPFDHRCWIGGWPGHQLSVDEGERQARLVAAVHAATACDRQHPTRP